MTGRMVYFSDIPFDKDANSISKRGLGFGLKL